MGGWAGQTSLWLAFRAAGWACGAGLQEKQKLGKQKAEIGNIQDPTSKAEKRFTARKAQESDLDKLA